MASAEQRPVRPPSLVSDNAIGHLCRLARGSPPGCLVEVGVYRGGTAWHLAAVAREQGRKLHLYDTFTGIPVKHGIDRHQIGDFNDVRLQAVMEAIPDAHFHVGVVSRETEAPRGVAFVHVDCDQYESYRAVIERFWPEVVEGGAMLFDDYGHCDGARAAVDESFRHLLWTGGADSRPYVVKA